MTAPSGPRGGRHGYVNGLPQIRNWSLNWNRALETRYHSATKAGPQRIVGVEDWTGTFEGFGGNPGVFPGDNIDLKLFAGPSDGVYGHTGVVYQGTGIIDSLTITWNFQPNASIGYSIGFSADSCLTLDENEYYDTSEFCEASMCQLKLDIADACNVETGTGTGTEADEILADPLVFVEIGNVQTATLTITARNNTIVNSSTNCCTQRERGIIEWTLSIVDQEQYPIWEHANWYAFKLYNKSASFWDLKYGMLQDINDIRVEPETGAITTKNNMFMGSGLICCGDGLQHEGTITDPDGVEQWPLAAV